jgi:DNA-binding NarL/FixJ family response regulator
MAAQEWSVAFDLLSEARARFGLSADDLDALGQAAWLLGRLDLAIEAHERAYQEFHARGRPDGAVMSALYLSYYHFNRGDVARAAGWQARALRLVQRIPDSAAAGYLGAVECDFAYRRGDLEACQARAKLVTQLGEDHQDPTIFAWGLHWQGLCLVKQGHLDQGWRLLDEAMLEVSLRRMHPLWAGFLHCSTIQVCEELGDPRRGWEWIETAERWLGPHLSDSVYSGICRMYKTRLLEERGLWTVAEVEAGRLSGELEALHRPTAARAYYELAQIKRLRGELDAAEELYRRAHHMGMDPQPGYALLRLAQGRLDVADTQIRRALEEAPDRLARSRILPHVVTILLAQHVVDAASDAADELESAAIDFQSPWLAAAAPSARGAVLLERSDHSAALATLRLGIRRWSELDYPYDEALTRLQAGHAHAALGDDDGARMEWEAAREIFHRLGALREVERAADLLGSRRQPDGLSDREVDVLRIVAKGRSNREIAAELLISEHTVARHMSNIFNKLTISSRAAAATYALKHGLV